MKVIELDITSKENLYEKYDTKRVSKELIDYLVETAKLIETKEIIQIVINKDSSIKEDVIPLIKEGLEFKYSKNNFKKKNNDKSQLILFFAGVAALILSTFLIDSIFKEICLIGGWVFLWDMMEQDIFEDYSTKKENKLIKKIINSKFIEK